MKKRIAALIITLAMVILFIPQTAFATETNDLKVVGIQVTEGSVTGAGISGSVSYNSASHTLTLNGAAITALDNGADEYSGIYNGTAPLTIHLIGDNLISRTVAAEWCNAIYSAGPLTITAEPGASLTVTADGGTVGNYGISAHKGLTITGGNITAVGGRSGYTMGHGNYGIFAENGKIEISGGSVIAVANDVYPEKYSRSFGIFCDVGDDGNNAVDGSGNINISGAIVSAAGGKAETSGGIESKYHLNISGDATVAAIGGNAVETYDTIVANRTIPRSIGLGCSDMGSVTIQDSTVIATGGSFSFDGKNSDVKNQAGRTCGIYCGNANGGVITLKNSFVVARAGTVDGDYDVDGNKRCAVFNFNDKTNLSEIAIKLDGVKVAGAVGYYHDGVEMHQNAEVTAINDYAINFDSGKPEMPNRTVLGISSNNNMVAATGVVIVPDEWTVSTPNAYTESMNLSGDTVIVNNESDALTMAGGTEIKTAGYTLAAVSLYEGAVDSEGIRPDGSVALSGGGKIIAVGGMTSSTSYGVSNSGTDNVTVNATTLTAYGFIKAVEAAPVMNVDSKDIAVVAFPVGVPGDQLVKIVPAYPLKVGGVQVTDLNKSDVLDDGTVSYNPQSKTLTLNGAAVDGISSEGLNLNLSLNGTNTVNKGDTGHGIEVSGGDLTIQLDGTTSVFTDAVGGNGVSVGGSLTVNGSGRLETAAAADNNAFYIEDDLTINGGTVTSNSDISVTNLTMTDGELAVTANNPGSGYAVFVYDKLTVSGGTLSANVTGECLAGLMCGNGDFSTGTITVSGSGKIDITAPDNTMFAAIVAGVGINSKIQTPAGGTIGKATITALGGDITFNTVLAAPNTPVKNHAVLGVPATPTNNGNTSPVRYSLTFNTNGGSAVTGVSGSYGTTVDLASYKPEKSGCEFLGWYSDPALTVKVTSVKLTGNVTVYAKWNEENPNTGAEAAVSVVAALAVISGAVLVLKKHK